MVEMFYGFLIIVCGSAAFASAEYLKGFQIKNSEAERLWVEIKDHPGFFLPAGQQASIMVGKKWTGKIRALPQECANVTCNIPYTEAVLKFEGEGLEDRYYVSILEGFNKPIKIQPTSYDYVCKTVVCNAQVDHHCPETHQVTNHQGDIIACKPAPDVFQKLCPQAIITEIDFRSKMPRCKSNTYFVLIG